MATPTANNAVSMDVPPSQNTAPVLHFRCLFTADTRRKQKRWQDGRLNFHTFNRRIMVSDEKSNFVGDAHWNRTSIEEGDEVTLERGGILVEVSEYIEKKDQDLTELIDKRVKEKEERFAARHGDSSPAHPMSSAVRSQSIAAAYLRPKPLNAILGTPTGHYGKALVPNTSPFEQRQVMNNVSTDQKSPRPAKRRKIDEAQSSKNGFAQKLMGATLSFTQKPSSTGPIRYEALKLKSIQPPQRNDMEKDPTSKDTTLTTRLDLESSSAEENNPKLSRVQPRKREKPSRGGYASSLTGASLSLSSTIPKRGLKNSAPRNPPQTIDLSLESSSEDGEDGDAMTADMPQSYSMTVAKPREFISTAKGPRSRKPAQVKDRSSSTTLECTANDSMCMPSKQGKTQTRTLSSDLQEPEKAHSSLRIRSRPRGKVMMFLNNSNPRPSPAALNDESTTSNEVEIADASPIRGVASLSSDGPLVFEDQEEEESRTSHTKSFGGFEMHQSSSAGFGIDYQTMDSILTRSLSPEVPHRKFSSRRAGLSPTSKNTTAVDTSSIPVTEENNVEQIANSTRVVDTQDKPRKSHQGDERISDLSNSFIPIDHGATQNDSVPTDNIISEKVTASATADKTASDTVDGSSLTSKELNATSCEDEQHLTTQISRGVASNTLNEPVTPLGERKDSRSATDGFQASGKGNRDIGQARNGNSTLVSLNSLASKTKLGDKVKAFNSSIHSVTSNGSTFQGTGRFMAKLLPSTNLQQVTADSIETASNLLHAERSPSPPIKTSTSDVDVKPSLASPRVILDAHQPKSGFVSANQISETPIETNIMEASSRPILINPATRGATIQNTARRTRQALAAVNNVVPPAPLERIGRGTVNDDTILKTDFGDKGPWSREANDLFGAWRPPVPV